MESYSTESINKVELMARAVQELSRAKDLPTVMKIVKHAARKVAGSDGCTFVLKEGNLCYYADEDAIEPLWKGKRFDIKECISGWVMTNRQIAVIPDIFADNRIPHDIYRQTFVKSLVMLPVREEEPVAAIGNYWSEEYQPSSEDLSLLQSLADVTAVTLENISVHNRMEELVSARTSELEDANKDLQSLAYSISHDLRAPLRAINGFMAILLDEHLGKLDKDAQEYIKKVQHNSTHMSQLIDGLFAFFKMGKKEVQKVRVPMKRLVSEIAENITQDVKHAVEFKIDELPDGFADHVLIKQVWQNLIGNAVKYSGRNTKPVIQIGSDQGAGFRIYYVKDNGAGFDPAYKSRLFGVFQRLHTQREFPGSGIGLAIVQKIISRHGGKVWADGQVDQGATFFFSLPTT
jgi:signal transduction histidine kinase